ncbi:OmpA family protein [Fluviicola taffensis]|uniref:OmpA family protein n=1 Tax=Fluviicola taffensis TaxID=191579 RepID=UPI003137DEB9
MFHRLAFLISFLLLKASLTSAQDSTAVYFKTGSHKISAYSQKTLETLFTNLDYTNLIEIKFIGYSDSIGNIESNQKLSERRAKAVSKATKGYVSSGISIITESKGELPRKVDSLSRRVDIIFRYSNFSEINEKDTIIIQPDDPRCFFIDQYFEAYSNAKIKVNKKKNVVYLQVLNYPEFSSRKYYYVKNPSQKNAVAQRVNFKLETTGKLWWREKRLTATAPKDSYDKYGLFYLENPPCEGCKEQLFKKDTNVFSGTSINDDHFIMSVTQLKAKLFRPNMLQIRIPKEFMEENESYYAVKELWDGGTKREKLSWETKRGKKRADYFYSKIRIKGVRSVSIASPQRTSYCRGRGGEPGLGYHGLPCGFKDGSPFPGEFFFTPGIHAFYHNDTVTAFVSAGVGYELKQHELAVNMGINHRLGLYYSGYYHFNFLNFSTMTNRMLDPWQKLGNSRFTTRIKVYAGPEFRSSYNKKYRSFSELNVHLGFSVAWNNGLNYYIQGGIARDLSNRINTGFYPYIQAGIRFRLNL